MNYKEKWNELSWKMQEAETAFSAILGWMDWQKEWLDNHKGKATYTRTTLQYAGIAISHALVSHFFVAICRIRESTNSKASLHILYEDSKKLKSSLDTKQLSKAEALIESTGSTFGTIKEVRGKYVAHMHGAGNPFQALSEAGISREAMQKYLNECSELLSLLGEPIGESQQHKDSDYKNEFYRQMYQLHSLINPKSS